MCYFSSGILKSKISVSAESIFSEDSEREPIPCLSPNLWWLLAILDIPWLVNESIRSLSPSLYHISLGVSVSYPLIRISDIGDRADRKSRMISALDVELIISAKTLFPSKVTF